MSKPAHTPGPWTTKRDGSSFVIVEPNGLIIAATYGFGAPDRLDEEAANSDLIAAAPKMLKALKHVKHGAEYPDELGDIIDDAIAEAEGRS